MEHGSHGHQTKSSSDSEPLQAENPITNTDEEAPPSNPNNVDAPIEEQQPVAPRNNMIAQDEEQNVPISNVNRIMRRVLPPRSKISDDAKEAMQACVSEFIGFLTSEANERCQEEHRKIVTAEDIIWAMERLGFDDYIGPLVVYLQRYRGNDVGSLAHRGMHVPLGSSVASYGVPPPPLSQEEARPLGSSFYRSLFPTTPGMFGSSGSHGLNKDASGASGSSSGSGQL